MEVQYQRFNSNQSGNCSVTPLPLPQSLYGRTDGRSRDYQIFSAWLFAKFSYPWCSAGALRALELRYKLNRAKKSGAGSDLKISQTQIRKVFNVGQGAPRMGLFPSIGVSVPKRRSRRSTTTNPPTKTKKEGGRILSEKDALSYRSPPFIGTWD